MVQLFAEQRNYIYPELPAQYSLLEYLQSSGTQYIELDYLNAIKFEIDTKCTIYSNANPEADIISNQCGAGGGRLIMGCYGSSTNAFGYSKVNDTSDGNCLISNVANGDYHINMVYDTGSNKKTLTVGSQTNTVNKCTNISNNINKLRIFAGYDGVSLQTFGLYSGKIYYMKLIKDNTLWFNLIPVKNTLTNELGMYDLVGKKFYGNNGTGEFIAGPEIKAVEYIQSSGSQYIDTDYAPNNTSGFEITGASLSNQNCVWIGSRENTGGTRWSVGTNIANLNTNTHYGWNGPIPVPDAQVRVDNKATLSVNYNNTRQCNLNGVISNISSTLSPNPHTKSAYLFTWNIGGSPSYELALPTKLYSCKITEGTSLVRNFIPIKLTQNSTTEYAMYDTVTSTVYRNAGTGSFTGGNEKYATKLRVSYSEKISTDYEVLEYLQSSGTQWINTGIRNNINIKVEYTFEALNFNSSTYCAPLSARVSNILDSIFYGFNNSMTYASFGKDSEIQIIPTVALNTRYNIVQDKTGLYTNGVKTSYSVEQSLNFSTFLELYMFARNNNGYVGNYFTGKLFSCKIWDNNTLVRDFIPVRKKSTNELGMLDKVNNVFYANAGTGTFIAGPTIEEVEYIQSSGTQYIDTGFTATTNTKVEAVSQFTSLNTQVSGIWSASGRCQYGVVNSKFSIGIGSVGTESITADLLKHTFIIDVKNKKGYIDGTPYDYSSATISMISYNMPIFAQRNNNTIGNYCSCKMYSYKIYDNNTLVRNLVPVKLTQGSTVEYAMLDKVENKIYRNAGTGSFTGGEVKHPTIRVAHSSKLPKLPSGFSVQSYITSTGTQYIDTGVIGTQNTSYEIKALTTVGNTTPHMLFGARGGYESNNIGTHFIADTNKLMSDFNTTGSVTRTTFTVSTNKIYTIYNSSTKKYIIDNETGVKTEYSTAFSGTITTPSSMYLFHLYGMTGTISLFKGKIHSCKIWENNTLVRDFVPAQKVSNSEYGMYDLVTNTFYGNAGTGDFIGPT